MSETKSTMKKAVRKKPGDSTGKIRDAKDLGGFIRERRIEFGFTQVQLAEACRCSPRFISELERGVAGGNIKQVIHICRLLGIDLFARKRGE